MEKSGLSLERKNNMRMYALLTEAQQDKVNAASIIIMQNIILSERPEPRVLFVKILDANYVRKLDRAVSNLRVLLQE